MRRGVQAPEINSSTGLLKGGTKFRPQPLDLTGNFLVPQSPWVQMLRLNKLNISLNFYNHHMRQAQINKFWRFKF